MPERPRRPDYDEKVSLHPHDPEDVLRRMLEAEESPLLADEVPKDESEEL